MFSSAILTLACAFASSTTAQSDIPLSYPLRHILSHAQEGPDYTYPTDLTQGIIPKAFHSHNDYWRPIPFYSALSVGALSIEADVWLYNGTLHVGHEESALTDARTFASLYILPILDVLCRQNPNSSFLTNGPTRNGVYDTAGGQTLYLFVDVKTDGPTTWPYVVRALQPLRDAGYLTSYNGSGEGVTVGPVTVIGTGNTPLNQVQGVSPRDYFWDAPIPTLGTTFQQHHGGGVADCVDGFRRAVWKRAQRNIQRYAIDVVGRAGCYSSQQGHHGAILGPARLACGNTQRYLADAVECWSGSAERRRFGGRGRLLAEPRLVTHGLWAER